MLSLGVRLRQADVPSAIGATKNIGTQPPGNHRHKIHFGGVRHAQAQPRLDGYKHTFRSHHHGHADTECGDSKRADPSQSQARPSANSSQAGSPGPAAAFAAETGAAAASAQSADSAAASAKPAVTTAALAQPAAAAKTSAQPASAAEASTKPACPSYSTNPTESSHSAGEAGSFADRYPGSLQASREFVDQGAARRTQGDDHVRRHAGADKFGRQGHRHLQAGRRPGTHQSQHRQAHYCSQSRPGWNGSDRP